MKFLIYLLLIFPTGCLSADKQIESKKILVYVIDTGVSPKVKRIAKYLDRSNSYEDLLDDHGHGTHVTGSILFGKSLKDPVCNEVKIVSCRFFYSGSTVSTADCFRRAREAKADFVNFSGGGKEYFKQEHQELKLLVKTSKVVVAAGNESFDLRLQKFYPASLQLPNMDVVANGTSELDRAVSSNYGLQSLVWVDGRAISSYTPTGSLSVMEGTSQAAALRTHELLKKTCQDLRSSK